MYELSNDSLAAIFVALAAYLLIIIVIAAVVGIFSIVCSWKIYEKAGVAGWKCLIPFYNTYCLFDIAWETKYFWMFLVSTIVMNVLNVISSQSDTGIVLMLAFVVAIFIIVLQIMLNVNLAKAFGYSGWFALGLIFLNIIFLAIIAFGKNEYIRKHQEVYPLNGEA